jgi:hypothetical protein
MIENALLGHTVYYLTIRLRARDFYEVIIDEGEARINYYLIEIESENQRSNINIPQKPKKYASRKPFF